MAANAYSIPIRVQGQPTGAELKSISNFNNNMWQSMETQHCNQSEWQMSRMVHEETIAWKLVKKTDPNKFLISTMHAPLVLQSGIAVTKFFQQIICNHMDKVHHMLNVTSEAICPLSLAASNCGSVRKTVQSTYSVRSETSQPVFTLERPHSEQMVQPKRFVLTVQAKEQGHDQEPRSAGSDLFQAKISLPAAASDRCSWMWPP